VRDLRAGYAAGALYTAGLAGARVLSAPLWGRAIDRAGPRAVLLLCSLGLAASPAMWLLAAEGRLWPIALDAVAGGIFAAGHGLAMFALPLAVAPTRERPFWHAGFAVAGGAGYAVASALAGHAAATPLAARLDSPIRLLLALSAVARVAAAGLAALLEDEPVNVEAKRAPKKREAALAAPSALGSSPGGSPPFAPWGSRRWEESSIRRGSTSEGTAELGPSVSLR
jgi:MFS family permease